MTARPPLETLTLARDYLDSLLAGGSEVRGDWLVQSVNQCTCAFMIEFGHEPYCGYEPLTDDPLTVALHATAPAIRELLAAEHDSGSVNGHTLRIATAILSTSHAEKWITDREAK